MNPKKIVGVLKDAIQHKEQILLVGPPGVGKTDVVKQACYELGADLIISHPAVSDPTDYKGLPFKKDDQHASFMPFGETWQAIQATKLTVWFIDDLGQASEAVQKALMQLLLGRRLNGHVLSEHVVFIAATNDVGQRAGVSGLIEPVKSRFDSIITYEPSLDDWCSWAYNNGQPAEMIAFLRSRPELLSAFEPTKSISNSPCPRTWASVGRRLVRGVKDFELFAGAVGKGAATEFLAFLELAAEAPSLDAILLNPTVEKVPSKPALMYLVATGLSMRARQDNFKRVFQYLERLPQSFRVMTIKEAIGRDKKLAETEAFINWSCSEEGKSIM